MSGKAINIIGNKYGKLTVLSRADNQYSKGGKVKAAWNCKCDCGNVCIVRGNNLSSGTTKSCGCSRIENFTNKKHGESYTRLYRIWSGMNYRCNNARNTNYKNYGARGIKVCDEWRTYIPFRDWAIKNGYEEGLTIERINSNGNYESDNCTWATKAEQLRNTKRTTFIEIDGVVKCVTDWAITMGISKALLYERIKKKRTPIDWVIYKKYEEVKGYAF